jgi:hypothetical protein
MFSNRMHLVAHGRKCVNKEVTIFVTPLLLGFVVGGAGAGAEFHIFGIVFGRVSHQSCVLNPIT